MLPHKFLRRNSYSSGIKCSVLDDPNFTLDCFLCHLAFAWVTEKSHILSPLAPDGGNDAVFRRK